MTQKIVDVDPSKPISTTVAELQLPPRPLIVLLGAFDDSLNAQVRSVCSRVIAPAALDPGALILDNASCSGCAALMAQAALAADHSAPILGIIPADRPPADIDANHDLVLRLPAAWPDSTKYAFQIADELVRDGATSQPAIAVLFGGSGAEKQALIRCARRGWPVLVLQGTGGIADQILTAQSSPSSATPTDPDLNEILQTAILYPSSLAANADDLSRILLEQIDQPSSVAESTLQQAWQRFDELDATATIKQKRFRTVEMMLITLAVLAALLAILTTGNAVSPATRNWAHQKGLPHGTLHWLVLLIPITISVIGAFNSHFRDGSKWILLRGAAEALKREIFRFRTRAGAYSNAQCLAISRELKLAGKLKDITSALEQSEVNKINLPQLPAGKPQRASFLSPEQYLEARLQDQVNYFTQKTRKLSTQLRLLQFTIYLTGASGTFLAAVHLDVWVALATALVTAFTTKLQADAVEISLVQYNQALTNLRNVQAWWTALSKWEKGRRTNIDLLVDRTETSLEWESAGWVQQMQSALDKLTEKEPQKVSR